jgi:hypothetical protein
MNELKGVRAMKPIVEGRPYPVFIEEKDVLIGVKNIGLRIGNPKPGETQTTKMTLTQARLLAYSLLREVEQREADMERLNEEARSLNTNERK